MTPGNQNHTPLSEELRTDSIINSGTIRPHPEAAPVTHYVEAKPQASPKSPENLKHLEAPKEAKTSPELAETDDSHIEESEFIQNANQPVSIHPDLKKHGLEVIGSDIPAYRNIKLPISDEKVFEGKSKPVKSSFRWLATFAEFMLWQAHITLKKINGHVVRVLKRK